MHIEKLKPFVFFIILLLLTTYGSLGSANSVKQLNIFQFQNSDKLIHGILYFLLTISLVYGMVQKTGRFKNWKVYLVVVMSPLVYGICMELLQNLLTSDRMADPADFLANVLGISLAFLVAYIYFLLKKSIFRRDNSSFF